MAARLGLHRVDHLDADGQPLRAPGTIAAHWPRQMINVDFKKVGRIPDGGGGHIHGRSSERKPAVNRAKTAGTRTRCAYLHSAVDGFSRLGYTEPLHDEKAASAAALLSWVRVFLRRARHHQTDSHAS